MNRKKKFFCDDKIYVYMYILPVMSSAVLLEMFVELLGLNMSSTVYNADVALLE